MYYDVPLAPRELYDPFSLTKMDVAWPHGHFRPSAVACDQGAVYVGDQFSIWQAELSLEAPKLRPRKLSSDIRSSWVKIYTWDVHLETRFTPILDEEYRIFL